MQGLHLTADLRGCRCAAHWLLDAVRLAYGFDASAHGPGGVTAALLLAESHLCVHTWPELGAVTLDVHVCNFHDDQSARAHALLEALLALFEPQRVERQAMKRGSIGT